MEELKGYGIYTEGKLKAWADSYPTALSGPQPMEVKPCTMAVVNQENAVNPPRDYDMFLAQATDIFVRKDRDYKSRFMRALCDENKDPRTLWAWEVEKKLDRIRTWVETGELAVKGEGVTNSVVDIFVYTVQYSIFQGFHSQGIDPIIPITERRFYEEAQYPAKAWLSFLMTEGLLTWNEIEVRQTILKYMGVVDD